MGFGRWKKLSEEVLHRNNWWLYKRDSFAMPSGRLGEYHYVETPGSVMVIPVTAAGDILLVSQYRYLNDRESLEFPGGGIPRGRNAEEAARKELAEEGGVFADTMSFIGQFNPYNGVTNEICSVFLAEGLRPSNASPDPTEEFSVHSYGMDDLAALIRSGEVWDGMTLAAWSLFSTRAV